MRGEAIGDVAARAAMVVRRATWAGLALALAVIVCLTMFDAGRRSVGGSAMPASVAPDAVQVAIAESEASGLVCTRDPVLADLIVFENLDGAVETVSFDEALTRSSAATGWVRSYCTSPRP